MSLFDWLQRLWGYVAPDPIDSVHIVADGLTFVLEDGGDRHLKWSDLKKIDLHLVQGGGAADRMHYIFQAENWEIRVARNVPGFQAVEDGLPRLPGFDHWTYAMVQRTQHDMRTPIWDRDKALASPEMRDQFITVTTALSM